MIRYSFNVFFVFLLACILASCSEMAELQALDANSTIIALCDS